MTLLHSITNRRLFLAILWGAVIFGCLLYGATKIMSGNVFENNILSLLPGQFGQIENSRLKQTIQQQAERQIIVLVKGENSDEGLLLAELLSKQLQQLPDLTIRSVDAQLEKQLKDYYFPYRFQLLTAEQRQQLETLTQQQLAEAALQTLYSPIRGYRPYAFEHDPFNLGSEWISSAIGLDNRFVATAIPSIKNQQDSWYIINAELGLSPFNTAMQQQLADALQVFQQHQPAAETLKSGLIFHTTEGTRIAKNEISTVGAGSLIAVLFLVFIIFRSLSSFIFIMATLGCSLVAAFTATLFIFEQVHLVTLAFGSTLLGLAADYSFHFLVKMRSLGDPIQARKLLAKGLIISCFSSVIAYIIQLFSPLPGLQQFAVFVAFGLISACITVFAFSVIFKPASPSPVPTTQLFDRLITPFYQLITRHRTGLIVIGLAISLAAGFSVYQQGSNDDIRLLNTSGKDLIETERRVQQLIGGFNAQNYFVISGISQQQVLERTELLGKKIQQRFQVNSTEVLISPSTTIPSLAQQRSDYRLIHDKLYGEHGATKTLCQRLNDDCNWLKPIPAFNERLIPGSFPNSLKQLLPAASLLQDDSAIMFIRDSALGNQLAHSGLQLPGIIYIDQVSNLTAVLQHFRYQVSWLLGGFFVCLVCFSLLFFSSRGFLIILSVGFSCLVALLAAAGSGITLFHMLALLLVIGIAVDTSVFYITPGLDKETWTAAALASLTSVIAFGLLSLSKVPILSHFGSVVFYGLICTWLVTPLIYYLLKMDANAP